MQNLRRYGFILLAIIALLSPFIYYASDTPNRRDLSVPEKVALTLGAPVERLFHFFGDGFQNFIHNYVDLRSAREESERLKSQNTELSMKLQLLKEAEMENVRLRELLKFVQNLDVQFLSGKILSSDPSFAFRSVRLNRGEADGVKTGMGVVATEGVVGMVMRTTPSTSDILLITDPYSNLDVIVSRNRRRGILEGLSNGLMQFKFSERGSRIQVGDEVVTSGLTGSFPRGLIVGSVVHIRSESEGLAQVVEVQPAVNFSELSEALVLLTPSREIELIRKIGGEEWMQKVVDSTKKEGGEP